MISALGIVNTICHNEIAIVINLMFTDKLPAKMIRHKADKYELNNYKYAVPFNFLIKHKFIYLKSIKIYIQVSNGKRYFVSMTF